MSELTDKLAAEAAELERKRRLLTRFPDLREYRTRWHTELVSKEGNRSCDRFYTSHSCGCCEDAVWWAWCYQETPDGKVYSDPPYFTIGEKCPYETGHRVYDGWEKHMRLAGMSEDLIARIKAEIEVEIP